LYTVKNINIGLVKIPSVDEDAKDNVEGEVLLTAELTPLQREHIRLGHLNVTDIAKLVKDGRIHGISDQELARGLTCHACMMGKMHRLPMPSEPASNRAKRKGEYVSSDVCGKMSEPSLGCNYFVTFVDHFTRVGWIYLMKDKSEVLEKFQLWIKEHLLPHGLKVGTLRTDGGEYMSAAFHDYCMENGIQREVTARYTPAQNGIAERYNRTLCEMGRTMMTHAGLGKQWWGMLCSMRHMFAIAVRTARWEVQYLTSFGREKEPTTLCYNRLV
jgi:transposase InsO family protein